MSAWIVRVVLAALFVAGVVLLVDGLLGLTS